MTRSNHLRSALLVVSLAACQRNMPPATVGRTDASTASSPAAPPAGGRAHAHPADIQFVRDMIAHHAQALRMTALVPSRTSREVFHLLAERMEVSQQDEIRLMQQWLRNHGESVPAAEAHAHHSSPLMPGMLTQSELDELSRATGREFEQMFLRLMIRHHEGAIAMVQRLFGTHGAAQTSEIYALASDVDSDQRAEIARMQGLLEGGSAR